MQLLLDASKAPDARQVAGKMLDTIPPVIWFIRRTLRSYRKHLSMPQFRTLLMVRQQPAATLSAVAEHLGSSLPTASRIVGGLVTRGLITRTGCRNDRRQVRIALTSKGQEALEAAWSGTQCVLEQKLQALDDKQLASLCDALDVLKQMFGSLSVREEDSDVLIAAVPPAVVAAS